MKLTSLPAGCKLRRASDQDIWLIHFLVISSFLDPTGLRPRQFWLVESENRIIACGQLRNFREAQELGSLLVIPQWRDRGLGTFLVQHLINEATKPLFLKCLGERLAKFYIQRGFQQVSWQQLPQSLQEKFRVSLLTQTLGVPVKFMQY